MNQPEFATSGESGTLQERRIELNPKAIFVFLNEQTGALAEDRSCL
ncbi:hypothetical protein ACXM0N_16085 [Peribacillus simplex]